MPVTLWPLANTRIPIGSRPVIAIYGPCLGGLIQNPATAGDQQIGTVETLYVDVINPAVVGVTTTCWAIAPGQQFVIPPTVGGTVTVNAATSGHAFSGYVIQEAANFQPPSTLPGGIGETGQPFPPTELSVLTESLPAYLYQQYTDDDDLQAFVIAFNEMVSWYINWFARLNPADYTQPHIQGALLDWVAAGLYGMMRPALPLGFFRTIGPLNTWALNTWVLNTQKIIAPSDFEATTDDIFKRILTWHIYKDDGDVFTIRWLKRRIERFLTGVDGTGGATEAVPPWLAPSKTYDVSVTFGDNNEVNINFQSVRRRFIGGALLNTFALNTTYLNEFDSQSITFPVSPLARVFRAAVDTGVLELPFQFKFIVNISDF